MNFLKDQNCEEILRSLIKDLNISDQNKNQHLMKLKYVPETTNSESSINRKFIKERKAVYILLRRSETFVKYPYEHQIKVSDLRISKSANYRMMKELSMKHYGGFKANRK